MSNYWQKRAENRTHLAHRQSDKVIKEIYSAYDKAIANINQDIDDIFTKYVRSNGLDEIEAINFLKADIPQDEYLALKAKIGTIKDKTIKRKLIAKLDVSSVKYRISRLEALKENIYIELKRVNDIELTKSKARYKEIISDTYYHNIYDFEKARYIYSFDTISTQRINSIVNSSWNTQHFSQRIWNNTEALATKLQETLTTGLMTGMSSSRLADELVSLSNYGKFACERLIRTESAYMIEMADKESAINRGVTKRKFIATLDLKTSKVCRKLDGSIVDIKKEVSGVNAPPMHPWCRSVMIDVIDDDALTERIARDPITNKTYKVPASTNYEEWYKHYVEENGLSDSNELNKIAVKTNNYGFKSNLDKTIDINKNKPNIIKLNRYNYNGIDYKVDGKTVSLEPTKKEEKIAMILSQYFNKKVELVPRINYPQGISTPDYLINGQKYDLKEIYGTGKSTIYNAISRKKHQADNFVIDISNTILTTSECLKQSRKVFYDSITSNTNGVIIIKDDEIIAIYTRI